MIIHQHLRREKKKGEPVDTIYTHTHDTTRTCGLFVTGHFSALLVNIESNNFHRQ